MSDKRSRRHFTAQQKAQVVRRHLAGKEAASDLADELGLQPSQNPKSRVERLEVRCSIRLSYGR